MLGPSGAAGEQDRAKLAEQAATERDAALAEARQLRVELAAHQAVHKAGADTARLLDSRTGENQLAALDPADPKFAEQLDTVIAAAAGQTRCCAPRPQRRPRPGGRRVHPGAPQTVTPERFARMTYAHRVELH
ncbi:hypothetical protein GCM10010260_30990 [Streptomyces filipinensis]|uniref:Uncharacterized protein n=1 Tax=Streptomyces filipinensis TaxID=66887 RepID=A0A918MBQ3_9ACTN|nr:hypothetical protein [Streptomyces filipinensis]GGU93726.1 hypothetical protein GCM10010260_30990 [Streptomyces filipinensis]